MSLSSKYRGIFKRKETTSIGELVVSTLRQAGFDVTTNPKIGGAVFDALAERRDFGRKRRILIEWWPERRPFQHQELRTINTSLNLLSAYQEVWIVARKVSRQSYEFFERQPQIRVYQLDEFEEALSEKPNADVIGDGGHPAIVNRQQIRLNSEALLLLIDEKIAALFKELPNSEDAKAERENSITEFENLKRGLQAMKDALVAYQEGARAEAEVHRSVGSFVDGVRSWWKVSHEKICDKAFDMGLFLSAVGICSLAGAGGQFSVLVSTALVGGKPVAEALTGMLKTIRH